MQKLALCQTVVSHFCMPILEEIVLGRTTKYGGPLEVFARCDQELQGSASYREWQHFTIRAIEQSNIGEMFRRGRDYLLHQIAIDIGHVLFTISSVSLSSRAQSVLVSIVTAGDV